MEAATAAGAGWERRYCITQAAAFVDDFLDGRLRGRAISLFSAYCFRLFLYDTLQMAKEPCKTHDTALCDLMAPPPLLCNNLLHSCRSEYQFHACVDFPRPLLQRTPILSLFLNLKLMYVPLTNNCRLPPLLLRCRVDKKHKRLGTRRV